MAPVEVEGRIRSAKDLKNVNWRHGDLEPYAVVWVHPDAKCSTKVDPAGDTSPNWDETLTLPLGGLPIDDATLAVDIVHAGAADGTKPLIGSARLPLRDVLDDVGLGERCFRTLKLKRPSGRPQGKLDLEITVREERYYQPPPPPPPPGYGYSYSRDYARQPPVGYPYGAPPPHAQSPYAAPPVGYPYNQAQATAPASASASAPYAYGYGEYGRPEEGKKGSKFGMGTGLAVGAVAGALGGLALAEGVSALEDKIADDAAERVEDDLAYDDYDGGDF